MNDKKQSDKATPKQVPKQDSVDYSESSWTPNSRTVDKVVTNTRPAPPNPNRDDTPRSDGDS